MRLVPVFSITLLGVLMMGVGHSNATEQPKAEGKAVLADPVSQVVWADIAADKLPSATRVVDDKERGKVLLIERSKETPQQIPLATINSPKIQKRAYVVRGLVRYDGVDRAGFLEMWNHFDKPREAAAFTRTMAANGPMGNINGHSPWREFVLPFHINDAAFGSPTKLQLNIHLPGGGKVWLSDVSVHELEPAQLQKLVQPASSAWLWPILIGSTILLAIVLAISVAVASFLVGRNRTQDQLQFEQRKMQALDLART